MSKVLVVATSRKTRGGITAVVRAHEAGAQWKKYHCRWIETHRDGNMLVKLWYLLTGWVTFMALLPSCDMVHIHLSEPPSAWRKRWFFMPFARWMKKKVIVHFHAFSPETTIRSRYNKVYGYVFGKADRVVVLSEFWRKEVAGVFDLGDKVRVIYNPCTARTPLNDTVTEPQPGNVWMMPCPYVILYAGTVNARKGYADMIRAFARIAGRHKDWMIVFAGNGEIEKGQALADELGIGHQTLFLGWVDGADKDRAFREATVFCLPSYAEGFPMGVLDAWAYGLPVITTPVGGIPDVAEDGKNMLLFKPGDTETLSRQMERMMTEESLRRHIAGESRRLAETLFSLDTVNHEVEALYGELLK